MACCKDREFHWCGDLETVYTDEVGDEYCVFHAPRGKKGLTLEKFNHLIYEEISHKISYSLCPLSGTVFEGDISFEGYAKAFPLKISLVQSIFTGDVKFGKTTLDKGTSFQGTIFQGMADFSGATFTIVARFGDAHFNQIASFSGCTFQDGADFSANCIFQREAFFRSAVFNSWVNFSGATFEHEAYFPAARFHEQADFKKVSINGKTDFSEAQFDKKATFLGETFKGPALFRNVWTKENVRFEGVNLQETSMLDTDTRKIDFVGCNWMREKKHKKLYDEKLTTDVASEGQRDHMKKVETLYRRLKQKSKEDHDELEVSEWHYNEKEMQRKLSSPKEFQWWVLWLYRLSSGYGERPITALATLLILIGMTCFSLALFSLEGTSSANQGFIIGLAGEFSFDNVKAVIVTVFKCLTFQRDAYLKPITVNGELVKLASQVLVPIQAALFALALRNKFRR